jgi:multimeric flavodoxin WrbA
MKIFSALGSSRKRGNTAALLEQYLKGIEENHSDIEITNVFIQEKNIEGCRGCNVCKTGKIDNCVIKDDMDDLYKKFEDSDIVVLSTPIYFFSMTSQLKTFMDRLYAVNIKGWRDKKFVLLATYGDNDEISSGYMNLINIIKQITEFTGTDFIQNYGVSTGMNPNFVAQDKKSLSEVYELGKKI